LTRNLIGNPDAIRGTIPYKPTEILSESELMKLAVASTL
jgi:hypothetical protein